MYLRDILHTHRQRWALGVVCATVLVVLSMTGCGDDEAEFQTETVSGGTPPSAALPLGETDPHAFTEEFIAHNPEVALHPGHIAILRLEPTGTHDGDTGTAEGVDAVPYFFAQETQLTLRLHESAAPVQRMVLHDQAGQEVARQEQGMEPTTITIQSGLHVLEVHHARKGEADAPIQTVFLRPIFETNPTMLQANSGTVATLEASQDCENCNFTNAYLVGLDFFGFNLSGSTFVGANLTKTRFNSVVMMNCNLQGPSPARAPFTLMNQTDFTGANLTGTHFDGALGGGALFTGATLDQTTWGPQIFSASGESNTELTTIYATEIGGSDFRKASLREVTFNGTFLDDSQFQGATIEFSDFRTSGIATQYPVASAFGGGILQTSCQNCNFSSDPSQNLVTSLQAIHFNAADLTGANLSGAEFFDVDMTGTVCQQCNFSSDPSQNLVTRLQAIFNAADLTGANLSGTVLDFDLSQTDLSHTILSEPDLTNFANFAGATLSDGVAHGVNLAGHIFPDGFTQFQGKDLRYANLSGAHLVKANLGAAAFPTSLDHANLDGATLSGANLQGASLLSATLTGADLEEANLQGANFTGANLNDAVLNAAQLQQGNLHNALLQGATLDFANLDGANLCEAKLNKSPHTTVSARLESAFLRNVKLANADLSGADMTNVNFYSSSDVKCGSANCGTSTLCASAVGATMNSTNFTSAYLNGVDMSEATPQGATFTEALLVGVNFTGANLSNDPNTGQATNFSKAFLQGTTFSSLTNTANASFTNAYVDLTSTSGARMIFLLDATHTGFTGYWKTPNTSECVEFTYTQPTMVPATTSSNTCPDGNSGPCTSTQWQSPKVPITQAPTPSTSDTNITLSDGCSFDTKDSTW